MAQGKVTLQHKDIPDETITVSESAVRVHEKNGWKKAPKAAQPADTTKS